MDCSKNEEDAVSEVKKCINQSSHLQAYINSNDRTPAWDGIIMIYKDNKKIIFDTIPTQVKSKEVKKFGGSEISYSLEKCYMESYLNGGGVVFFVVQIINSYNTKIYYSSLLPYDIKELLNKYREKEKVTFQLNELNKGNIDKIETICFNFKKDRDLQFNYKNISVPQRNIIKESSKLYLKTSFPKGDKIKYLLDNPQYLYAKTDGVDYPIDKILIDKIKHDVPIPISIDNKIYYNKYTVDEEREQNYLIFGNEIKFCLKTGKVNTKYTGNFEQVLYDLHFLKDMLLKKELEIGNYVFSINTCSFDLTEIDKEISFLENSIALFKLLNIKDSFEIDKLKMSDLSMLNNLINALIYNKSIQGSYGYIKKMYANIGETKILLIFNKIKGNQYTVKNFFSDWYKEFTYSCTDNIGNKIEMSNPFILLKSEDLLSENLNIEYILNVIKNSNISVGYLNLVNNLVLELIKAHDKKHLEDRLKFALDLVEWIISIDNNTEDKKIFIINKYQIILRKRKLLRDEINQIIKLKNDTKEISLLCALNILLGNKNEYLYYFDQMDEKKKNIFRSYPIYYLVKTSL